MPTRRLPYTIATRFQALDAGKTHKDMMPPPSVIPYKASTIAALDLFHPLYKGKIDALDVLLLQQVSLSAQMKTVRPQAELLITHFYEAMQNAVKRGLFLAEVRTVYGLDANDGNLPVMKSEAQITYWGGKAITGEAARMALPGAVPITFPSIAEVSAAVTAFNNLNLQQGEAKTAYDNGQESIALDAVPADQLILKMWNETEAEFNTGDKPSMRRKSREWGVVYVPTPGEAPSPEDFSILGTVTAQANGLPLEDVAIKVVEIDEAYLTDADGEYFIPVLAPGTYTLEVSKTGFTTQVLPGVAVVEGEITEVDVVLSALISVNGTVAGTVTYSGTPTAGIAVSIEGIALPLVFTDASGHYSISGIPAGAQTVRAQLPPALGGGFQTQGVIVVGGSEVNAGFAF
jgi:hypothetical protein